jgi:hypothetical protein
MRFHCVTAVASASAGGAADARRAPNATRSANNVRATVACATRRRPRSTSWVCIPSSDLPPKSVPRQSLLLVRADCNHRSQSNFSPCRHSGVIPEHWPRRAHRLPTSEAVAWEMFRKRKDVAVNPKTSDTTRYFVTPLPARRMPIGATRESAFGSLVTRSRQGCPAPPRFRGQTPTKTLSRRQGSFRDTGPGDGPFAGGSGIYAADGGVWRRSAATSRNAARRIRALKGRMNIQ